MSELLMLLTTHFVADFVLQTDWMAQNKSKRWDALVLHVTVYSLTFVPVIWYLLGNAPAAAQFIWITFVLHFITDAITSRINSRLWPLVRQDGIWAQASFTTPKHDRTLVNPFIFNGSPHWFFVGIGADQLSHALALAWAFSFVVR